MTYLEALAAELYTEAAVPQGPPWDQLGDVTRSVWIERARQQLELVLGAPVGVDIAE